MEILREDAAAHALAGVARVGPRAVAATVVGVG
jgi:hypothetical protein